jgi:hypothetical protein
MAAQITANSARPSAKRLTAVRSSWRRMARMAARKLVPLAMPIHHT